MHVISPVLWGAGEGSAALPPTYFDEIEADAQQGIEEALKRVHAASLEGQTLVMYGVPFDRIITTARDKGVDLIVMGTHGRTGLLHLYGNADVNDASRLSQPASCEHSCLTQ